MPNVLAALIQDCLPGISENPPELAMILSQRSAVPLDPVERILGDLDIEEVSSADVVQEFKFPGNIHRHCC